MFQFLKLYDIIPSTYGGGNMQKPTDLHNTIDEKEVLSLLLQAENEIPNGEVVNADLAFKDKYRF